MLFKSLCVFAAFAASVRGVPVKSRVEGRQAPNGVPDFVMTYAPKVWLHKDELYFPTDISTFVQNTIPRVNFNEVSAPKPLSLNDIKNLGSDVYLTSKDQITANPAAQWIKGTKPDGNGKTNGAVTAVVIVNDKGDGVVDAFYMYYYAYNYGGDILGIKIPFIGKLNFGNHVGDWEHNMIRFKNGVPEHVWFSQHANGQAFKYDVVEKEGLRPIAYSSKGSHANYGKSGKHDHLIPNLNLPGGVLEDDTNKGTLWDPVQSAYFYKFNGANTQFTPYDDKTPVDWMYFRGRWGDQEYPTSDKRQLKIFGQARFSSGPTGPIDKQLNRKNVCPDNGLECILWPILISKSVSEEDRLKKEMKI